MVSRAFLMVLALSLPVGAFCQKSSLASDMEASIATYWTESGAATARRAGTDSVESQILSRHREALSGRQSSASLEAERKINDAAEYAISGNKGYRRVTCSISSCEVVVVIPKVDGSSEAASEIIGRLHNRLVAESPKLQILSPSMILEGSDTSEGFTILYYVHVA